MKRYALIVGISQYGSNMLGDLQKPASDAEAIAQILEKHGDFQEVKRLPANWLNHYQCEVADSQLTGEELTRELKYFLLEQAKNSEALIYFSGHGFAIWDDLGEEYEGFLATSNCEINREREKLIAQQNGISLRRLNGLISKAQVSSLVVILDCCHAGSLLEDDLVKQALITFNTSEKDYYLIAACRSGEKAYEGKQYSIFTEALLKGLAEENAGNDGKISCDRVFDLIDSELQGLGQEPIRMGSGRSITLVTHTNKIRNQHCEVKEECPYQSLKAFEAEQKQFFFGRKQVVNDILARLTQKPFVPVIGASGSGKSSVIRAGVIPELEDRGWRVLDPIKPGFEPLIELRRTFRKFFLGTTKEKQLKDLIENQENTLAVIIEHLPASEQFLLVVDQFEEVFTICADREERQRFIQLLTQVINVADSPLAVAITLRADFLEPCLDYPSLTKLIQTQAVFIPSLTGIDLQDAIKEPAKLQGYSVQDKLFMKILEDVNKEPGFLPLLEFTLTELWQKRDREKHQLTLEQYEKLGELNGTLNSHAEKVYNYKDFEEDNPIQERTQQEKDWIKLIFLRLIRTGKDKKDTRQRQPKAKLLAIHLQVSASPITGDEIEKQEILSELLDGENGLVKGRLLVSGKDQEEKAWIDLAHEALIEGWQRFSQWRQENWALRKLIDRVEDLFWEWQKEPDNENLMMGGLLRQVRRKWLEIEPLLEPKIKKYYQLSYDYKNNYEKHLKSTMYPHMTQELAEDLLQLDDDKLGGDHKEVSILFSDIRDYTTLIENLEAEKVVSMLNEYFESMVEAVFTHKGTLDKYIGDAIMAVYGSPLPLEEHAWMAVQTSLEMRNRLYEFNQRRRAGNKPIINIGIGINSDTVISGNIGSSRRMEFTTIGNGVNLASRLERLSKQYGCDIILSDNTYKPCQEKIWSRELDYVRIKGRNEPVAIYELIGFRNEPIDSKRIEKIEHYHQGRKYYVNRQFNLAKKEFENVLQIDRNDLAARMQKNRCNYWLESAPKDIDKKWDDGVWTFKDKLSMDSW